MVKASETGGSKPMSIVGRLNRERERLVGMTDEERAFRNKFLKAQILSPTEPRNVPELYKELHNPIRRFYRFPLDQFQKAMEPLVGAKRALIIRYFSGKAIMGLLGVYYFTYYFKYNAHDWTRKGGWNVYTSRKSVLPGDPGYPQLSDKTKPSDYSSRGFEKVTLNL
ncbi:hypothetical protein HHI36_008478 [Cryptolaemus montrouzieri]|uniref:NADH dehydrogenase [ubiquinone] 1 beta subcomplex subunit 6 n=1 Tax=Cryptolaemus montrouzieri TaxID=559131 RepID=A0ABD2MST2_9CUCU